MKNLSIKQIMNLKAFRENGGYAKIWTAKLIAGNWEYGWYDIQDVKADNDAGKNNYWGKNTDMYEYSL